MCYCLEFEQLAVVSLAYIESGKKSKNIFLDEIEKYGKRIAYYFRNENKENDIVILLSRDRTMSFLEENEFIEEKFIEGRECICLKQGKEIKELLREYLPRIPAELILAFDSIPFLESK